MKFILWHEQQIERSGNKDQDAEKRKVIAVCLGWEKPKFGSQLNKHYFGYFIRLLGPPLTPTGYDYIPIPMPLFHFSSRRFLGTRSGHLRENALALRACPCLFNSVSLGVLGFLTKFWHMDMLFRWWQPAMPRCHRLIVTEYLYYISSSKGQEA